MSETKVGSTVITEAILARTLLKIAARLWRNDFLSIGDAVEILRDVASALDYDEFEDDQHRREMDV